MLDPDWLRAVLFKCNTSEKRCNTSANCACVILDNDWLKTMNFSKTLILTKMMTKILCENVFEW